MINNDPLYRALDNTSYNGYVRDGGSNLTSLVRTVNIRPRPKTRADTVNALYHFYTNKDSIVKIYDSLNKYEKALLTCIVQSNYYPLESDIRTIANEYKDKNSPFTHLKLFNRRNWGLIIYDEVHMLPAPVFRITAGIQSKRRLGLTATLIREDGMETDVFSLIGPKKYDIPWKSLEKDGYIA